MMTISGKTQLYAVIGDPIGHTLSPAIQNAAFQAMGIDAVFAAFQVAPKHVGQAMDGVRGLGIRGLNITMPDKEAVIPYINEVDETAKVLCSVNTILNEEGKLRGFSTDGTGAHRALEESNVKLAGKRLLLLGAGGAARAIAFSLAREVKELTMLNRTPERTKELAEDLNRRHHKKITAALLTPENIKRSLENVDILINATSVGMSPNQKESLVKPVWLCKNLTVMDIVYNPIETKLAKDAKAAGAKVISGVDMLIHQGAASFEIWTGKAAPVEVMRQVALAQLKPAGAKP